ncbi:MAG: hemerythrin domain-containing protein [Nitrosospira sp.]
MADILIWKVNPLFNYIYKEKKVTQQPPQRPDGKNSKADVIELLKADHKKVKKLFKQFEDLKEKKNSNSKKTEIVKQICLELTLHAQAEEAILYPAARKAIKDEDLMDEADVEHAGAKELIAQLQTMSPEESHYDAKVTVLSEYIEHHVNEEEREMFPMLKKTKLDRQMLGERIRNYKDELKNKIPLKPNPLKKTSAVSGRTPQTKK